MKVGPEACMALRQWMKLQIKDMVTDTSLRLVLVYSVLSASIGA